MIASFEHNFVFIKTHKTGGTSVEIALTPFCGPRDIITPISLDDEKSRIRGGVVQARNYASDKAIEMAFRVAVLHNDKTVARRVFRSLRDDGSFFNHMPAVVAGAMLPGTFWQKAYKFTVQRHPYEKVVSWAYFRLHRNRSPIADLPRYLDEAARLSPIDDTDLYTIDGRPVVDRVMRQEHLADDLGEVARQLGIGPIGDLPRAKGGSRVDQRPARQILSADQREIVFTRARQVFDAQGYEP